MTGKLLPELKIVSKGGGGTPLTIPELQGMVEELLPAWMNKLGCPHWSVTVVYGECVNPEWAAGCRREAAYEIATITLDPAQHFDREDVERSLLHELLHVKLAAFDVYRDFVSQNRKPGTAAEREESVIWTFCIEQAVKELRRLVRGMGGIY